MKEGTQARGDARRQACRQAGTHRRGGGDHVDPEDLERGEGVGREAVGVEEGEAEHEGQHLGHVPRHEVADELWVWVWVCEFPVMRWQRNCLCVCASRRFTLAWFGGACVGYAFGSGGWFRRERKGRERKGAKRTCVRACVRECGELCASVRFASKPYGDK